MFRIATAITMDQELITTLIIIFLHILNFTELSRNLIPSDMRCYLMSYAKVA